MAECEMTCRAGMRVLYDLAGGSRKRWAGLDEDLRATPGTAKRVFARNDNWPQQFGAVNYKDLVAQYAVDEYSTLYGALVTIKETLRAYDAFTPEVQAVVAGIDAESDEATIEACLDRLSDVIYATARPASRAAGARPAQGAASPKDGDPAACVASASRLNPHAGDACRGEENLACPENLRAKEPSHNAIEQTNNRVVTEKAAQIETGVAGSALGAAENVRDEKKAEAWVSGASEAPGAPRLAPGTWPAAEPAGTRPPHPSTVSAGTPALSSAMPSAASMPTELSFADLRELLCAGPRRVLLRTFADDAALMAELLPTDILADCALADLSAGALSQPVRDELALRLCTDGGMGCREIIRRCERLLRAADRDALAAGIAALEERHGLRPAVSAQPARSGVASDPDYLAEPLGYLAVRFAADPARRLFVLTLLALLGRENTAAVLRRLNDDPALCSGNL